MRPITSPLNDSSQGSEVTNLHDGLLLLLDRQFIPTSDAEREVNESGVKKEQSQQVFGKFTKNLVTTFQKLTGLNTSGEVDAPTAEKLNQVLRDMGAFSDSSDNLLPEIQNINKKLDPIVNSTENLAGINARLGDYSTRLSSMDANLKKLNTAQFPLTLNDRGSATKDLQISLSRLGTTIPQYELDQQVFGVGTQEAIISLQARYKLPTTGIVDEATRAALGNAIGAAEIPTARVEGRILFDHGLPAGNIILHLYNRGFGGAETALTEVQTDSQGFYTLPYDLGSTPSNLEIRAVDAQGQEISLSSTRLNADKHEVLNLVAPATIQPLAPEYQRLSADLTQKLGELNQLAEAQESDDRPDITLLHQDTGWDARLIVQAATAEKLNPDTGIPQEALYALFRVGLPMDKDQLAQVDAAVVEKALTKAMQSGIVSLNNDQIAATQAAFKTFARTTRLNKRTPDALSNSNTFLLAQELTEKEKNDFADLYFSHQGTGAELWEKAKKQGIFAPDPADPTPDTADAKINSLQLQGKLAYLTLNNANLTETLRQSIGSADNLANLVSRDFYQADTWTAELPTASNDDDEQALQIQALQILQANIPAAYIDETIAKPLDRLNTARNAYAADLARKVRLSFPTQVVERMIAKDELILGDNHATVKTPVQTFLQNATTLGFKLGQVPLDTFIQQHEDIVFQGIAPDAIAATIESVKTLQRLYQMAPTDEALRALLAAGFTSAQDVTAFDYQDFLARFGDRFASVQEAQLVYRKAQQISSVTLSFFTTARQLDSASPLYAMSPSDDRRQAAKRNLIKHYPTMQSLFGTLDFCECEHCRSVLSPAAYFVDLLQFIDPKPFVWQDFLTKWKEKHSTAAYPFKNLAAQTTFLTKWRSQNPGQPDPNTEKTPYEVLTERRPDLSQLPLTCENTNTALPYIDVVNEILEYYVANNQLDANAVHDTGLATTPELLAEPQNILPLAYDNLKQAKYPLGLPFDLWLETVRRIFSYFETPLWQVLKVFRPAEDLFDPALNPKPYYQADIFAESLNISSSEYQIFTAFDATKWYELYGYTDEPAALTALSSAKTLSQRLGVSYKELIELVQTGFVNPRLETLVTLRKLELEVEDVFRYKGQPGYLPFTPADQTAFEQRLTDLTTTFQASGFNAKTWLNTTWQNGDFNQILVLADPNISGNFDLTTLQYANGAAADGLVFLKLNLFVRLWRKLGWTMETCDRALQTFIPRTSLPLTVANLGIALKTALVYLAHLEMVNEHVNTGKNSHLKLLTLWSNLATTGRNPLYAQLFLTPSVLKNDPVFDDALGNYLSKAGIFLKDHRLALQGAVNLTAEEIDEILVDAGKDPLTAELSLENVSLLYRYGLLAKALKLSVHRLIVLKGLSGLNPFQPLNPAPLVNLIDDSVYQTLEFIKVVETIKNSGFQIEDLDYLLRHQFDPVGKYRPNPNAGLTLLKSLAIEIQRIQSQNAVPTDPLSLTDDLLRQKLALLLPSDAVETLLQMWTGTVQYRSILKNVAPANQLDPAPFATEFEIQVSYDEVRQEQTLIFRGVLLDAKKQQLTTANSSPVLAALLNDVQSQINSFFVDYPMGFATQDDFMQLFAPIPDDLTDIQQQNLMRDRRAKLAQAFLLFLQQKLIRQLIVQTLATNLSAEPELLEALLTDVRLLRDPSQSGQPLLNAFAAAGESGVSATFIDGAGKVIPPTQIVPTTTTKGKPNGTNSAIFTGYLEVPTAGAYRFFIQFDRKDASGGLRFAHLPGIFLRGTAANDGAEISQFTELKPGVLYSFSLEVSSLGDGEVTLLVQGENLPKGSLSRLTLYPQTTGDRLDIAQVLLAKTLQLIQGFGLSQAEIIYLLTHATNFDNLNLSQLPARPNNAPPELAKTLFRQFLRLADYTRLKGELASGTDDLIGIFAANSLDQVYQRMATLTRRTKAIVQATAEQLPLQAADFRQEKGVQRLWDALQLIEKLGIPPSTIPTWATPTPDFEIARDLKNTLKAKYDTETWQRIARSIFDPLRQRQRDALVAYILHKQGFDSINQLFEYFLIDPGMEPVVQTSRLRLAISSMQLFIQRCLLNLEPQVHPSTIHSQHWQWMKQYRVWEANRKIFLFPENWLEPEFRDDKTNLFQDLESVLLQGDVSNDLAEDAFFNYLKKLDELAQLEMVTMYCEEKTLDPAANILHVIGRTYNLPHKYFYRRFANQMWTPWEPITTEIEGDHVVAVIWRDRLHLFWVTFLEKAEQVISNVDNQQSLKDATFQDVVTKTAGFTQRIVQAQLNWSEYFQGQWTTRSSGGFDNPISTSVGPDFHSRNVFINVSKEDENGEERAVKVHLRFLDGKKRVYIFEDTFRVVSKNSPPLPVVGYQPQPFPYSNTGRSATQYQGSGIFNVTFSKRFVEQIETVNGQYSQPISSTQAILQQSKAFSILPCSNVLTQAKPDIAPLVSPFFYQDDRHTFLVEPSLTETPIVEWEDWGIGGGTKTDAVRNLGNWVEEVKIQPDVPRKTVSIEPGRPWLDSSARFNLRPQTDWVTNPTTVLQYGDRFIGQTGGLNSAELPNLNTSRE
ncbi:peptidoglycan-binding protein [Cyanobacteria bacterium FACHB-472]|nr:peptidoglycan-binding protein [Cyanobacteria bacterium FACHB-472]